LVASLRSNETAPTETAPLNFIDRLPATKYGGAAKDDGAMSHCPHRNVNPDLPKLMPSSTGSG
jgi:hypothetical protein